MDPFCAVIQEVEKRLRREEEVFLPFPIDIGALCIYTLDI